MTRPVSAVSMRSKHTGQVGNSDITAAWSAKYGIGLPASSVFIRTDNTRTTWHVSGWVSRVSLVHTVLVEGESTNLQWSELSTIVGLEEEVGMFLGAELDHCHRAVWSVVTVVLFRT